MPLALSSVFYYCRVGGFGCDYDDGNNADGSYYDDSCDVDYNYHDHYHEYDGPPSSCDNQSFWYVMFCQLNYLFPLLIYSWMY